MTGASGKVFFCSTVPRVLQSILSHQKATSRTIICQGILEPELESVGVFEEFEYYSFHGPSRVVLHHVAPRIIRCGGTSPRDFCSAIDRIFVQSEMKAHRLWWQGSKNASLLPPKGSQGGYDIERLSELLDQYSSLTDEEDMAGRAKDLLGLSSEVDQILQLSKLEKNFHISRIGRARMEAAWCGDDGEGLGRIRSRFCGCRSLFRLTIWEAPRPERAQVYRIPASCTTRPCQKE